MTKRKFNEGLDNMEKEDISLQNQIRKIEYNKENIEKILYKYTNKNVEVFLGHLDEQGAQQHSSATDRLIEQIQLYALSQTKNVQHYLIVNLNEEKLVDRSYLAYLHYSDKHKYWKCSIIPLIDYNQIKNIELSYIEDILGGTTHINISGIRKYYDITMISAAFEQVIEYARLRIQYPELNKSNLEQYKSEFDSIKLADADTYTEAHKKILEQLSISNGIDTIVNSQQSEKTLNTTNITHNTEEDSINEGLIGETD